MFSYDGVGHRTVDAETVSGTTTTTYYEWCPDRQGLTASGLNGAYAYAGRNSSIRIPNGLSQAAGGMLCQTRNSSETAIRRDIDEGEYNVSTGQQLVYLPDQLGSVRDVIDASTGNLVQSYDYTPYGAVARSNGSTPTDYQYAGLFNHPASGLNFSATRALDGVTGRWINRDLIREAGGINLYAYIGAKLLGWTDRRGLFGEKMLSPWDSVADRITGIGGQCPTGPCSNAQTTQSEANVADAIGRLLRPWA